LARLAQCSLNEGVRVLRLQGTANIQTIRAQTGAPVIGLIKRDFQDSEVYITPTSQEVEALIATGCEVIALDGTSRIRPRGEKLPDLIQMIHRVGKLAMADCDSIDSIRFAIHSGADIVSTTLSGYTHESSARQGPDLELVAATAREFPDVILLAEGRYETESQVSDARRLGAMGVVIGGAINDPLKMTKKFLAAAKTQTQRRIGAVDLGGTWLRFGEFIFDPMPRLLRSERIPLPPLHTDRLEWIESQAKDLQQVGISAGGVIDPQTSNIVEAKAFVPDYVGNSFSLPGREVVAMNDGLAQAFGHAQAFPLSRRVATLALGTGVGCGVASRLTVESVDERGDYPRLNDQTLSTGQTFEDILGGLKLGANPSQPDQAKAIEVASEAYTMVRSLFQPNLVVVCGGVGLSSWLLPLWESLGASVALSPYGADAGLFGAAWLAYHDPMGANR
jgi:putative N-acetylmannosamine-6-phosphate epimerase